MFLIWYDNDRKRPLGDKVAAAAERYTERFGKRPALVLLNPTQAGTAEAVAGLPVRATSLVSPNHLYVGEEEAGEAEVLGAHALRYIRDHTGDGEG